MSKYITIKKELDVNSVLYDGMSNQQVADELNAVNKIVLSEVPVSDIESYLFQQGIYSIIVDLGNQAGSAPETVASKAITQIFNSKKESVDVNHSTFETGLASLVTNNDLTQAQSDYITALGSTTVKTLNLPFLHKEDIRIARAQ